MKKAIRTLQSEIPILKEAKDLFYYHMRRTFAVSHETDFKALRYLAPSRGKCFVDVGANQGQSIESILLARPGENIVSFEPNPPLAENLARRYKKRENVRVVGKGLSDSPGTFTLFVPCYKGFVYDGAASLNRKAAASFINEKTVFRFDQTKLTISEVQCTVETLDAQNLSPAFIKLDVEGHEYNVLNGGRATLRQWAPVLLIESFRSDPRTVQLTKELRYQEYYFDGKALRKGSPTTSPNSYLLR
jgi:FkbM family methyltransferase